MKRVGKQARYQVWRLKSWTEQFMMPMLKGVSIQAKKQLLLAVMILAVMIPINYYLFSQSQDMAVASDPSKRPTLISEVADDGHEHDAAEGVAVTQEETALQHAAKHADPRFVCPMHPEIVTEDPEATCPICGMDLVVLEDNGDADVVELTPTVINNLGVRMAKVRRRNIYRTIDSVGYITYDEKKMRTVTLRTEGWVETLAVKSVGERVKQGDLLFEVYSPKLVNAQEEYLQALEIAAGDDILLDASRERLLALGVSRQQIERLAQEEKVEQYVRVYAPQDGVIAELNIREGEFVPPSKPVINLVDLSSVWLMVDIFESQADWVKEGLLAEAALPFMPDKMWEGEVEYVYPALDPKTRSLKARLRFDNPDESLKPNMYADVRIFASPKRRVLTIPREAVIRVGNQARVIVSLGEGRFKPVIIHPGIETDDKMEVVGGLEEGQEVVVSSQFLIDSESSMRAAMMRMAGG